MSEILARLPEVTEIAKGFLFAGGVFLLGIKISAVCKVFTVACDAD